MSGVLGPLDGQLDVVQPAYDGSLTYLLVPSVFLKWQLRICSFK